MRGEYRMDCEQAIYENNYLNKYLIVIDKSGKANCKLDNKNKSEIIDEIKDNFDNKLNENEKNAEEKIKKLFDEQDKFGAKEKGKNVVVNYAPPLKINENKQEPYIVQSPYGHVYQDQNAQNKGKGKYILIESDEEMEYNIPNNIDKNESAKPDQEHWEDIYKNFGFSQSNGYL
uniref:Uncharacterized protein n=1 Tax=Meloidogyne floridensis TaxID=298350 RepID=A0A915NGG6_9BILA